MKPVLRKHTFVHAPRIRRKLWRQRTFALIGFYDLPMTGIKSPSILLVKSRNMNCNSWDFGSFRKSFVENIFHCSIDIITQWSANVPY